MNWIEIGKDRENLPKEGDVVVLAYLDPSNRLRYVFAMRNESCYYHGKPVLISYDSGDFIKGIYIAYAGPLPQFNYDYMYDLVVKLFDFLKDGEVPSWV